MDDPNAIPARTYLRDFLLAVARGDWYPPRGDGPPIPQWTPTVSEQLQAADLLLTHFFRDDEG